MIINVSAAAQASLKMAQSSECEVNLSQNTAISEQNANGNDEVDKQSDLDESARAFSKVIY